MARAPRRARLTARKKGSGYENALNAISTPYSTSVSVPLYAITARSITNQLASSGVGIGFTFLPHVIIPDKRHGVHWLLLVASFSYPEPFLRAVRRGPRVRRALGTRMWLLLVPLVVNGCRLADGSRWLSTFVPCCFQHHDCDLYSL